MTPFAGFFLLAIVLASQHIMRSMCDGHGAMPFEHLPCNGVDLDLGNHGAPPDFLELHQVDFAGDRRLFQA
jgi:hypothetical protein